MISPKRQLCLWGAGPGLARREIALKLSEILRLPSIGLSAAELQHRPRAACHRARQLS